jgi:hypothetical protein
VFEGLSLAGGAAIGVARPIRTGVGLVQELRIAVEAGVVKAGRKSRAGPGVRGRGCPQVHGHHVGMPSWLGTSRDQGGAKLIRAANDPSGELHPRRRHDVVDADSGGRLHVFGPLVAPGDVVHIGGQDAAVGADKLTAAVIARHATTLCGCV